MAMTRYARQMILPEIGAAGQSRLAAARVLVVGAGGLGSTVLPLLAGAGVGALRMVDHDVIEESNLHRQTLYRMSDLGRPKAEIAADALRGLNPDCAVTPEAARLDPARARARVAEADLVIDAADAFAVTYALSDACLAAGVPLIAASVLGRAGHVGGFCGGAPSYRAVFPDLPPGLQSCATGGVMGPAVAVLGALQAQMALSVLLGLAPSPLGLLSRVDLASWQVTGFRFDGAPEPSVAGPVLLAADELLPGDTVIELRDMMEAPEPAVPGARRVSPAACASLAPAPEERLVFACATGLRAWRAAQGALARGHRAAVLA
ncbi:HesA/MoeB/ThiF family protein [Salipiger thiooxidans]|nr:HesA/MoeB/ThiF family protein [Salipiger thiooxidans]MCA0847780.1 HesA/MoeB/ThiF family protein [Salipiger thiooxidans]